LLRLGFRPDIFDLFGNGGSSGKGSYIPCSYIEKARPSWMGRASGPPVMNMRFGSMRSMLVSLNYSGLLGLCAKGHYRCENLNRPGSLFLGYIIDYQDIQLELPRLSGGLI
jgi:hypothetical protein